MSLTKNITATILFFVAALIASPSYAENDSDSLNIVLSKYKTPIDKINALNDAANEIILTDTTSALLYLKKAISIGEQNNLYSNLGDSYRYIGNLYNKYGYGLQTKESYNSSYEYYNLSSDSIGLAKITNNLGVYYYQWPNNYKKSLLFLERSLELKKLLKFDDGSLANTYFNLGNVHLLLNNYIKSLKFYFKCLKIVESTKEFNKVSDLQNHIAQVYIEIEEFDKAEKYLKLSLKLSKQLNTKIVFADNYLLYSNMHLALNQPDSALIKLSQAEIIYTDNNNLLGLGRVYNKYVEIYTKKEEFDKVFIYANLSINLFTESGAIFELAQTYSNLGKAYFKTHDYKQSRNFINKSQVISLEYNYLEISVNNYLYLAELDYKEKKYQGAYSNFSLYSTTRDSIFSIKKSKIASEIEDKYAINKKEIELELLSQEKQKVEIERDKNKTTSNYLMLIIILVLIVLSLLFYLYYSNRKLNETLEELVQERTKELKKTNRLLANSKKNEEDVSRIKSDLLKNISESLKTPISEIQNLVKILKGENEENDELYEQLELITSSTYRLNSIIKSITELYTLEEKKRSSTSEEFEFDKLIVDIVDNYETHARARELNIIIENPTPIIFRNDIELVSNAVDHLLKTVVDYANKGDIVVKLFTNETSKIIEMCSSSFNINKRVFNNDLSTNVNSDARQIDRMFINLYVTKKMVDKMGGNIHWESSNSGEGIKFVMSFPNDED
ncbi:MAG: tetratricopeptide repeat-containing sensor histidine kinase [Flavobacteriales bacterium]|nr:tetratricopeptide repeat-containing sensor histidine kinase [Flavobacteriales bacterium]